MTRRPTIREVAARANVSVGSVSHVLTGRKTVRPATRAAIDAAIRELGYVPDSAARALIARRVRARLARDPAVPRLTAVGYLCADYTARVAVLPHRDDRVAARGIEKTLGGCAANVAVTAAGLGPPLPVAAELLSVVGEDPDSDWAVGALQARRVELHPLSRRRDGRLSRCFILVEAQGTRTIVNEPLQVPPDHLIRWLETTPRPAAGAAHGLHLQGDQVDGLADVLPRARADGFRLSMHAPGLAAGWRTPAGFARLRDLFDLLVLNRETAREALDLGAAGGGTAELVRRLGEKVAERPGGALVALTLGPEGAALLDPGQAPARAPAPFVEPVDTTGAGDSFVGVLLAGWLNGVPAAAALPLAVAAASRSVAFPGAQEHGLTAADLAESGFERFT